jgi:hypothetical protein
LLPFAPNAVRTGGDGAFALRNVAAGEHRLRIDHRDFARRYVPALHVADGARVEVPPVRLDRGTALSGIVTAGGRPAAHAEVLVVAEAGGTLPPGTTSEARADDAGRWRLPVRLPPGPYRIAGRRAAAGDPFAGSADLARSRMALALEAGEPERRVELDIPSRDAGGR